MSSLRPIALCCVTSLALPTVVSAQPSTATTAAAAPEESGRLGEAEALYKRGRSSFETANYLEAIDLWEEAYGLVQDVPENAAIKAALIFNIAAAQEKAYDIDTDVTHLRQASVLMETYARSVPALYGEGPEGEAELEKIEARLTELRARIEAADAEAAARQPASGPDPVDAVDPVPEPTVQPDPKAKPLLIAGAVTAGLGVAGLGLMAGGLAIGNAANDLEDGLSIEDRRAQFDRGRTGDTLAIVGGVAGGALLVTGAVLVGIGLKKRSTGRMAVAPWGARAAAGATLRGRF